MSVLLGIGACAGDDDGGAPRVAADSVTTRLELVATIDPGEAEPFLNVSSLALDGDGNVYVLDQGARHIRVFDSTGAPLRTIGREGQGPGEFATPYSLAWTGDTLAVLDPGNGRIELVTRNGDHTATWPGSRITGRGVRLWQAGPSRFFLDSYRPRADGQLQMLYVAAGPGGGTDTLVVPERIGPDERTAVTCKVPNGAITWYEVPFASRRVNAVSAAGVLVVARTGDYRFTWVSPAGEPRGMLAFGAEPLPITDAAWDSATADYPAWREKVAGGECDAADLPRPAAKPAFRSVDFDDRGRMWVEATTGTGYRFDVWEAAAGERVGSIAAPARDPDVPVVVRGSRLALVEEGQESQRVMVYRVPGLE